MLLRQLLTKPIATSVASVSVGSVSKYAKMAEKSAVVLLANGSEEMEFTISVDVLRRAGVKVTVAGVNCDGPATCSRGVVIQPDMSLQEAALKGPYDAVVLPGGLDGSQAFSSSAEVGNLLKDQEKEGRLIAAICAAPLALKNHRIGIGKNVTCYPSVKDNISSDYQYSNEKTVVHDGNILTSQGPGTAFEFALHIAKELVGEEKVSAVKEGLLLKN
ncbi:protein dj-1beta [Halyomorpha halys]|uniref:protein dj-1beta n=1 Tax=Halyomorpha halys TaxID=286706 RepID=UPI0006D4F127|nr:protein dj-1beta-like [Halyomorpha halys]